jgi:3-isopropylmalate dehydratase small subunit
VRVVIAASFGEIFFGNCLRNGIVPIILPEADVVALMDQAEQGQSFTVDLEAQVLSVDGRPPLQFAIPSDRRLALLNGWDETDQILNANGGEIDLFETRQRKIQPWLYA